MPTCPSCRGTFPEGVSTCPTDGEALLPDEAFASVEATLKPGTMVGEYKVETLLGEGGFGAVYRASHPLIGKIAAVKLLNRAYSSDPQIVSRFIAEARAVNQIRHPNIIDIFSFGHLEDGRHFFVMELLDGESLQDYLNRVGRLSLPETLAILRPIARAIDAAHAAGIAHRDLKPDNIYLARTLEGHAMPKLLDFGIAKLFDKAGLGHKTRTGAPMGTPDYMSPEQCQGIEVDQRTDVYSLGVIVHRALSGALPFQGNTLLELLVHHSQTPPPALSTVLESSPREVDAPLLAMMAKSPADRPATAGAALDALEEVAVAVGMTIAPLSLPVPPVSSPRTSSRSFVSANTIPLSQRTTKSGGASGTFMGAEADVGSARAPRTSWMVGGAIVLAAAVGLTTWLITSIQSKEPVAPAASQSSETTTVVTTPTVTPLTAAVATSLAPAASSAEVTASASATIASVTSSTPSATPTAASASTARPTATPPRPSSTGKKEWENPY